MIKDMNWSSTQKGCKIRNQGSRKLVATTTRTPKNIYVLDEIESEKCHLGKEDESWLWHRRMGHIHFDNLVKIYKNQAVQNMPEVTNPANSVCEQCQHGKQTRVHFKRKSILLQNLWSSFTLTYVDQPKEKDWMVKNTSCYSLTTIPGWHGYVFSTRNHKHLDVSKHSRNWSRMKQGHESSASDLTTVENSLLMNPTSTVKSME